MASLFEIGCGSGSGNIGLTTCDYNMGPIIAHIAAPKGASIPASALVDYTSLVAFLKTKLQDATYASRWFIMGRWKGWEKQGQDTQFYTFPGDGSRQQQRKATAAQRLQHNQGQCYHNQLIRIAPYLASGYDFFRIDNNGVIGGVAPKDTTTGIYSYQGAPLNLFFPEPAVDADNTNQLTTWFVAMEYADVSDLNENSAIYKAGGRLLADLQAFAVKDIRLDYIVASVAASGIYYLRPQIGCGGTSLVELVPAVAATTYWTIVNDTTGAAITPTAIAVDPLNPKNVKFTLDTTDTDYPTPPAKIRFTLKGLATVLTPIGAYEQPVPLAIPSA